MLVDGCPIPLSKEDWSMLTTVEPAQRAYFVLSVPAPRRERAPVGRARDRRGYYRSPITMPEYRKGQAPANKGRRFPPEPLRPREVLALIEACGRGAAGRR